jgi:flagellar motor component MotA
MAKRYLQCSRILARSGEIIRQFRLQTWGIAVLGGCLSHLCRMSELLIIVGSLLRNRFLTTTPGKATAACERDRMVQYLDGLG